MLKRYGVALFFVSLLVGLTSVLTVSLSQASAGDKHRDQERAKKGDSQARHAARDLKYKMEFPERLFSRHELVNDEDPSTDVIKKIKKLGKKRNPELDYVAPFVPSSALNESPNESPSESEEKFEYSEDSGELDEHAGSLSDSGYSSDEKEENPEEAARIALVSIHAQWKDDLEDLFHRIETKKCLAHIYNLYRDVKETGEDTFPAERVQTFFGCIKELEKFDREFVALFRTYHSELLGQLDWLDSSGFSKDLFLSLGETWEKVRATRRFTDPYKAAREERKQWFGLSSSEESD